MLKSQLEFIDENLNNTIMLELQEKMENQKESSRPFFLILKNIK